MHPRRCPPHHRIDAIGARLCRYRLQEARQPSHRRDRRVQEVLVEPAQREPLPRPAVASGAREERALQTRPASNVKIVVEHAKLVQVFACGERRARLGLVFGLTWQAGHLCVVVGELNRL